MTMPKRKLGTNGPEVGALGFGAMSFAGFFGPADDEVSLQTLAAAEAAGIDFWDTANIYGTGRSEAIIGRYFKEVGAKQRKPQSFQARRAASTTKPAIFVANLKHR